MSPIAPALAQLSADIARLTAELGRRVDVAALGATDRRGQLKLHAPGRFSANRACRLFRAADGWIARQPRPRRGPRAGPGLARLASRRRTRGRRSAERRDAAAAAELIERCDPARSAGRHGSARSRADRLAPPTLRLGAPARRRRPGAAARGRSLGALGRSAVRRGAGGDGRRGDQGREHRPARPHPRLDARLLPPPERPQGASCRSDFATADEQRAAARRDRRRRRADHQRPAARLRRAGPRRRRRCSRPTRASSGWRSPAMAGAATAAERVGVRRRHRGGRRPGALDREAASRASSATRCPIR